MFKEGLLICKRCGFQWYGPLCGRLYCDKCVKIVTRERQREYARKKKEEKLAQQKKLNSIEISRLADAEGLSYGKYCLKHGI